MVTKLKNHATFVNFGQRELPSPVIAILSRRRLQLAKGPTHMNLRRRLRILCGLTSLGAVQLVAQAPGDTAPPFTLQSLDGHPVSLSQFKGHPVVINFWGSWCPPCRDEIPLLVAAYRARQDMEPVILAVNGRDQETSTGAVRKFVAEFQMSFPVLLDENGKVRKRYRLLGLPTTVFIGADGVVRAVNIGPLTAAALQQHLAEIMAPK
jgi:cytochrome c biogenesis protein CcmG/thiol:disulfide interchange protein DsbE